MEFQIASPSGAGTRITAASPAAARGEQRSGLSGTLDVFGQAWTVAPRSTRGLWLTWRRKL